MKSKYFFEEFKEDIKKDHKKFDTHLEATDIPQDKCNHKGKVKIINGKLVCSCGAGWEGPQIETLFALFNK